MATHDPRGKVIIDANLTLTDVGTAPGAIASAGNTAVTSTNKVDLRTTTFWPTIMPRVIVRFPKGVALTSLETLYVRVRDCATSGGTYVRVAEQVLTNESLSSDGVVEIGIAKTMRYIEVYLYLENTASTSDLSSYTYPAWISPHIS